MEDFTAALEQSNLSMAATNTGWKGLFTHHFATVPSYSESSLKIFEDIEDCPLFSICTRISFSRVGLVGSEALLMERHDVST